jgi:hypothetical protein
VETENLDGAWITGDGSIRTLYQTLVVEDGEDMRAVAQALIGPKGKAVLQDCSYLDPGDQWPTAVYRGTRRELGALHAKTNGSKIGKPPKA